LYNGIVGNCLVSGVMGTHTRARHGYLAQKSLRKAGSNPASPIMQA